MYVRFWGVSGSIAAPLTNDALRAKIEAAVKLALQAGLTDDWQVSEFIKVPNPMEKSSLKAYVPSIR